MDTTRGSNLQPGMEETGCSANAGDPGVRSVDSRSSPIAAVFLECERSLRNFVARFFPRAPDIDDIVQEVFLRAYGAERQRPVQAPKAYLFSVARNVSLKEIDRRARHNCTSSGENGLGDFDVSEVSSHEAPVEDQLAEAEKLAAFCRAVATLPPQCRRAFLMRKIHGLSYKNIADEMGVTVRTVEKHVAAGLQRCSAYLRRYGHDVAESAEAELRRRYQRVAGSE